MDHATKLVESSGEDKRIDVDACANAMQQLETTLETAAVSGLAEGLAYAKQLVSSLNVKSLMFYHYETHKYHLHSRLLFRFFCFFLTRECTDM